MADSAPTQRRVPVGCRFRQAEKELVAHCLRRKVMADDDPSIHGTTTEIDVCKYEPWALLAASGTMFDDLECFFFSPRDYKYSNSTRWNGATLRGFWKVIGRDQKIIDGDTNNAIGTKRTLVFHERRIPFYREDKFLCLHF